MATATFTFDAREQTVWLDPPRDGNARAGELCARHANTLRPPQGWRLEDRRQPAVSLPAAVPVPSLSPSLSSRRPSARLDALLAADTPLLARAFEAAGNS